MILTNIMLVCLLDLFAAHLLPRDDSGQLTNINIVLMVISFKQNIST